MLFAVSGVSGGASQAAYARLVEALSACTALKSVVRIFQHGSATARFYGVFEYAPPRLLDAQSSCGRGAGFGLIALPCG